MTETPWYVKALVPAVLTAALAFASSSWSRSITNEQRLTRAETSAATALLTAKDTQEALAKRLDALVSTVNQTNQALSRIEGRLDYQFGPGYDTQWRKNR